MLTQARLEKLNGDLHQPSRIRYVSRSFSVRCFISLEYCKWIDFGGYSVCCGTPQAIGIFLHNKIGDHTGDVLSHFLWGFFRHSMFLNCSDFSISKSGLGHVFLVVYDRSKFCVSLSIFLLFLSLFLPICGFFLHSRVYTWVFLE